MAGKRLIRKRIEKRLGKQYESRLNNIAAFTGNASGVVSVPGKTGFIYVRDWYGLPHIVYNDVCPVDQANYFVRIGYDKYNPSLLRVLGMMNPYVDTTYSHIGSHHSTHEWPGNDVVWVQSQQVVPALVIKKTGLTVAIYPFWMETSTGLYRSIPYQELDLTSYVPASGACWALISFAPDGTRVVTTATTASDIYALVNAPIDVHPDHTYLSIAAVALYLGQTDIRQDAIQNQIVDLRWFGAGGGSSGDMFRAVYDTDDDGVVDDSQDTQAIQGNAIDPTLTPVNEHGLVWNSSTQQYEDINLPTVYTKRFQAIVDPTVDDDTTLGYKVGYIWINTSTPAAFICIDNTDGSAVWQEIGAGTDGGGGAGDLYAYIDGALSISTGVWSWLAPRDMTLELVYIYCLDPGSASSTIVDVNLNGTTIFTTQANRPELAFDDIDGWAVSGIPEFLDIVEGDILSFDIDQIGTDAEGLVVVIKVASSGTTPPASTTSPALKVYMATTFK
jgi:hypothetical protein